MSSFDCLSPKRQPKFVEELCLNLFSTYEKVLDTVSGSSFVSEVEMWREVFGKETNLHEAVECSENAQAFPNVAKMLSILTILPVTTAENEDKVGLSSFGGDHSGS